MGARDLQPGERLEGVTGPITVAAVEKLSGRHRVYNLTVQGEHVYRVASLGVLVHNNRCNHGYAIYNSETGEVYKFGVSRGDVNASGQSRRARSQVTKIANDHGLNREDVETSILPTFPTTDEMFKWEKDVVGFFRSLWGSHALPDNIRPRGNPF